MIAAEIMTEKVISIPPDRSVKEALELLLKNGINQIPVVGERGDVLGIISIKLILSLVLPRYITEGLLKDVAFAPDLPRVYKNFEDTCKKAVSEVMEKGVKVYRNTSVLEVVTLLGNPHNPVDALLVVDEDDKLLGIISRIDAIKCLCRGIR